MSIPSDPVVRETFFRAVAHGVPEATEYLKAVCEIVFLADDSVDEELPFEKRQDYMLRLLHLTMCVLPSNAFQIKYGAALAPLLSQVLIFWQKSDEWKMTGDLKRKVFGYVRRENIDGLLVAVAGIVGGIDHAKRVTELIFDTCHDHEDTLEDWMNEGRP